MSIIMKSATTINEFLHMNGINFVRFGVYEWDGSFCMEESYFDLEFIPDTDKSELWNLSTQEQKDEVKSLVLDSLQEELTTITDHFPIHGGSGVYEYYLSPNRVVKIGELYLIAHFSSLPGGEVITMNLEKE